MIIIDGSQGEGGGQILRSSLALSLVTGKPVTIENVRAGRQKPGLMRQHLAAVQAAQQISDGDVAGDEIGSRRIVLRPGTVKAGEYRFSISSAGSTTLVFQTVLPSLMLAEASSKVELLGGTHNPFAPPFDFLTKAFSPQLHMIGPRVEPGACTAGFYPAGGGRCEFRICPAKGLESVELLERGEIVDRRVRALVANLPMHIGERECRAIARKTGWPADRFQCEGCQDSQGPGNVVLIELEYEHVTEVFAGFGKRGKRAELVADEALRAARTYMDADVPVGAYLADQLLLPMGVAAHFGQPCSFRTMPLTKHSTTHIEVLQRFLDIAIVAEQETDGNCTVRLAAH